MATTYRVILGGDLAAEGLPLAEARELLQDSGCAGCLGCRGDWGCCQFGAVEHCCRVEEVESAREAGPASPSQNGHSEAPAPAAGDERPIVALNAKCRGLVALR